MNTFLNLKNIAVEDLLLLTSPTLPIVPVTFWNNTEVLFPDYRFTVVAVSVFSIDLNISLSWSFWLGGRPRSHVVSDLVNKVAEDTVPLVLWTCLSIRQHSVAQCTTLMIASQKDTQEWGTLRTASECWDEHVDCQGGYSEADSWQCVISCNTFLFKHTSKFWFILVNVTCSSGSCHLQVSCPLLFLGWIVSQGPWGPGRCGGTTLEDHHTGPHQGSGCKRLLLSPWNVKSSWLQRSLCCLTPTLHALQLYSLLVK